MKYFVWSLIHEEKYFSACDCDKTSSNGCDEKGICLCKERISGKRCNQCKHGFYGYPACKGK